jgi:hypothetical protein
LRSINSAALDELAKKSNVEPINIIGVQWTAAGHITFYADKKHHDYPAKILELADLDNVTQLGGSGASTNLSITLADEDGTIKDIINRNDVHRRPVKIYQSFEGFDANDKFIIFEGEIATPITWKESDRTVSFQAITKLTDVEIGFAPESGQFPEIHQDLLGKPWPLCFGTPQYVPCQRLQEIPTGIITEPFGVVDPTLLKHIAELGAMELELLKRAGDALRLAAAAHFEGDDSGFDSLTGTAVQLQDQSAQLNAQKIEMIRTLIDQQKWERTSNHVIGGERFPQRKRLIIKIDEVLFKATFVGRRMIMHPIIIGLDPAGKALKEYDPATGYVPSYVQQGFTFINAGAQVTILGEYSVTWIANIIPSTDVKVFAYRSYNGLRKLTLIPRKYYDVQTITYGDLNTTAVVLKRPLSSITYFDNEKIQLTEQYLSELTQKTGMLRQAHLVDSYAWEDDIFVTLTSSVGPNPVDIIAYLIQTYTDKEIDPISFGIAHNDLVNYPMDFAYFDRPNVFQAIQDLAYQARCALWIQDNTFHIKYLPKEVAPVATLTLDDIQLGSLELGCTPTEDLITKYVASWRPDYAHDKENTMILRHNVTKYGTLEESFDYYAYTNFDAVHKSATFWLIRRSNSWKKVTCKLFISKLFLEPFDTVLLNFGSNQRFISNSSVKALVESISYDSNNNDVNVTFWLPIRFGEMIPYLFAWPAGISERDLFPFFTDVTSGNAGSGRYVARMGGTLPAYNGASGGNGDGTLADDEFQKPTQPLDYGKGKISDIGDVAHVQLLETGSLSPVSTPPFNYTYKGTGPLKEAPPEATPGMWPGEVVSGGPGPGPYTVAVSLNGMDEAAENKQVTQLQIHHDASIPPTTKVLVGKDKKGKYFMQVPVLLSLPPASP